MGPPNKKRKLSQPDAIVFDPSARQEYLTGFHKRKEQRKKHAQDVAAKQEKEERLRERRQIRQQRKLDLEKHMDEFNAELRKQNPDMGDAPSLKESDNEDEAWNGIEEQTLGLTQQDDYVQEDKYTTVTVEPMGEHSDDEVATGEATVEAPKEGANSSGRPGIRPAKPPSWHKGQKVDNGPKPKKKKFRYESKAERQATRQKQARSSRAAKARRKEK